MTETPEQLRKQAARIRQLAQYADDRSAYHAEMQQAEHLEHRAREIETGAAALKGISVAHDAQTATSKKPTKQAKRRREYASATGNRDRRTGNRSCVSGTPVVRDRRKTDLAKIHLLKKDAGLDDDAYRDMLERLTGQRSAGKLNGPERNKVLIHLSKHANKKHYPGRPNNLDKSPQLRKIEALLAEAKRPWKYAHAMAEKMYHKKRLEWCDGDELGGIIAALMKDAVRQGRRVK